MGLVNRHFLHGKQVGLVTETRSSGDHLRETAGRVEHELVRQQHRERLVADNVPRAPHRVAEAERRLLPGKTHCAGLGLIAGQNLLLGFLAARFERGVELEHAVEMILDHALVAAGDEHEVLDAGLTRLVDHVLDQRLVDDGQHFLRHRLGGGQDAGAEAGDGKDGFADFHGVWSG